jgi:pimeloyl-ACP methyl ester carboxylesterase
MKHDTVTCHASMNGVFDGTAYSVAGEGPALVLIHGVGMNRSVWAPQVDALQLCFRVVTYDMHSMNTLDSSLHCWIICRLM